MGSINHIKTLVLTSQYVPVSVCPLYTIPGEDAMRRWTKNPEEVILFYNRPVLTQSREDLYWPSIIVNPTTKNTMKQEVKLWKENLLYRDDWKCFFCGEPITKNTLTKDHYTPQKDGGKSRWDNIVASCSDCNHKKGSNQPTGRWKGKYEPYIPSYYEIVNKRRNYPIEIYDERWLSFIPVWNSDIIVRSPFDGSIVKVIEKDKQKEMETYGYE